jgi:hypothetical protein
VILYLELSIGQGSSILLREVIITGTIAICLVLVKYIRTKNANKHKWFIPGKGGSKMKRYENFNLNLDNLTLALSVNVLSL